VTKVIRKPVGTPESVPVLRDLKEAVEELQAELAALKSAQTRTNGTVNKNASGIRGALSGFWDWANGVILGLGAVGTPNRNTIAIGSKTQAFGGDSIALGVESIAHPAEGGSALAIGYRTEARGSSSLALGFYASVDASAGDGVAIGYGATAGNADSEETSFAATAIGVNAHAEGLDSVAVGYGSSATSQMSTSIGVNSKAEGGFDASAFGYGAHANGDQTTAVGVFSYAEGDDASAFGYSAHAEGDLTTAVGIFAKAEGTGSSAFGFYSEAYGTNSTAMGRGTHARGEQSTAMGVDSETTINAENSAAIGKSASVSVEYGTAVGVFAGTSGGYGTAVGPFAHADGENSIAIGYQANGDAFGSVAVGRYSSVAVDNAATIASGGADGQTEYANLEPNSILLGYQKVAILDPDGVRHDLSVAADSALSVDGIAVGGSGGGDGETPTLIVGTVTTLDPGESATAIVEPTATPDEYELSFGIPAGEPGENGDAGPAPTFTVDSVTTLAAGSSATVEVTGTSPDLHLTFGIPQGENGDDGTGSEVPQPGPDGEVLTASAGEWISAPYSDGGLSGGSRFKGEWSYTTSYDAGDLTFRNGKLYEAKDAIIGAVGSTYNGYTRVSGSNNASDTLALPVGSASGDLQVLLISTFTATLTVPSGFTLRSSGLDAPLSVYIYTRIASDTSPVTVSGFTDRHSITLRTYKDVSFDSDAGGNSENYISLSGTSDKYLLAVSGAYIGDPSGATVSPPAASSTIIHTEGPVPSAYIPLSSAAYFDPSGTTAPLLYFDGAGSGTYFRDASAAIFLNYIDATPVFDDSMWNYLADRPLGSAYTTALRPADRSVGDQILDTTLGKPIWRTATGWVDATGAAV
jgi:hypothetical protein